MAGPIDIYLIRNNNLTWVKYSGVVDLTLSGSAMKSYSQPFRDIFQSAVSINGPAGKAEAVVPALAPAASAYYFFTGFGDHKELVSTISSTAQSDEVSHWALRQTQLTISFWKIDRGASVSPRYLYAQYQEGDIFARNPPQTE